VIARERRQQGFEWLGPADKRDQQAEHGEAEEGCDPHHVSGRTARRSRPSRLILPTMVPFSSRTGSAWRPDQISSARASRRLAPAGIASPVAEPASTALETVFSDSRRNGRSAAPMSSAI